MPRFYFHLFNDLTVMDEEGVILANAVVALQKGLISARQMAAQSVLEGRLDPDHRIDVAGADGTIIGTIRFGQAVKIKGSP